jgi:hypothetical protein
MASSINMHVQVPGISHSQILPSLGHSNKLSTLELCIDHAEGKSSGVCTTAINQAIDQSSLSVYF